MPQVRLLALLLLAATAGAAAARAEERNAWPVLVRRENPTGGAPDTTGAGPFLFSHGTADGGRVGGFRPFYVRHAGPAGETIETTVLYPLFFYRRYGAMYTWSVFDLINRTGRVADASPQAIAESGATDHNFDVWPIYFSHQTADPDTSYRGLLPIHGDVRGFFGYRRISWTIFPLYVQTEKTGSTTTYVPWPIVRRERGREEGFAVWPLFGHFHRDNGDDRKYWLWPLAWRNTRAPDPDAPPTRATLEKGIIPFYTHEEGPSGVDQAYLWPFFGYTDRTLPQPYHETRYFWPFLVQGHGEVHSTNRWGPFYTDSFKKGVESTWVLWPLWNRKTWVEGALRHTHTRFFFFFGSAQEQRSVNRPNAAPAVKRHVFPLFSSWDNGAGRKQVEVLSPFEPLFTDNPEIREAWSPLFALYRSDQRAPGDLRASLLWNAVTWERKAGQGLAEFHLGPLFGMRRRADGAGWRLFWFDFPSHRTNLTAEAR